MVALVRKKGATRQRGLKLRLRDLGKIWVSGFGPWEPAAKLEESEAHVPMLQEKTELSLFRALLVPEGVPRAPSL